MKEISKNQIAGIQTAIRAKGLLEQKINIVQQYTNGRASSVAKMYFSEAHELLKMLNASPQPSPVGEGGKPRDKMIRSIIAMAWEMGWIKTITKVQPDGSMRKGNDYSDLHSWILKYGYMHKPLNDYKYNELPTLVTQFKEVYKSKMKIK